MMSVRLLGPLEVESLGILWARRPDGLYEATNLPDAVVARLIDIDEPIPAVLTDATVFVAGSAVLSVLLDEDSSIDLDVFFAAVGLAEPLGAKLREYGWHREDGESSGGGYHDPEEAGHWVRGIARHIDLVAGVMPLAERLTGFDVTVCQVAWCGDRLVATREALDDIPCRRLRVTRVTRPQRVRKYLARGLLPYSLALIDRLRRRDDVAGWTDSTLTREQAFGRAA
jgi:hypothetical protein